MRLKDFLKNLKKYPNGVLQKWVSPFGPYNNMLKISWTPKILMFERKQNLKLLKEDQYDMYERAATFDAPEYFTKLSTIQSQKTTALMHQTTNLIVQYLSSLGNGYIKVNS